MAEPMRVGSLARTIAHELEYNFSLTHPGKSEVSTLGRLMGGRKQDYALTEEDVTKARKVAQERSELERNSTFRGKNLKRRKDQVVIFALNKRTKYSVRY
jgi:hypothetical protein